MWYENIRSMYQLRKDNIDFAAILVEPNERKKLVV